MMVVRMRPTSVTETSTRKSVFELVEAAGPVPVRTLASAKLWFR